MPGLHAKKGPSGAKRLHECVGSVPFVASLPPEMRSGSGAAARLGTASHTLLEVSLRERNHPSVYAGRLITVAPDAVDGEEHEETVMLKKGAKLPKSPEVRSRTYEVDDEMLMNVELAWDYVERRCAELSVPMESLLLETRTNPVPDRTDTWGTADVTIDGWPLMLEVVDYKNGRLKVEHEDNPQLLAYLAGMAHDTGWMHDAYQITVVQPNGRHTEGKVRPFPVTKEALLAFVEKHRGKAETSDIAADEFTGDPTDTDSEDRTWAEKWLAAGDHCEFCDAAPACPANKAWREKMAREAAQRDFPREETERVVDSLNITSAAEAIEFLKWRTQLLVQFRMADRFLAAEAKAGRMPNSMKYVRKRSKRQWKPDEETGKVPSPAELAERMIADGYLTEEKEGKLFKDPEPITGPQAEKLVPSKLRKEWAEKYLHTPPGGLKLVPVTEPGEPVEVNAADDFIDDEEEDY